MAVIKISSFGGEQPSVSPRNLPVGSAQLNKNLYLATSEFRPLMGDTSVASIKNGTQSMHRFARDTDGNFNVDTTKNWITSMKEVSYVKGQIDDERTERTYISFDDGSAKPRSIDVNGADRILGVPRPVKPTTEGVITDEFTPEEAETFLYSEAAEDIRQAIIDSALDPVAIEPASRYIKSSNTIIAGPSSKYNLVFADDVDGPPESVRIWWNLYGAVGAATSVGAALDISRLGATQVGSSNRIFVPLNCLPWTTIPVEVTLKTKLEAITQPVSGEQLLPDDVVTTMLDRIRSYMHPDAYAKSKRNELDEIAKEFSSLMSSTNIIAIDTKPVEPTKPTTPEYEFVYEPDANGGGTTVQTRTPEWVNYDREMETYRTRLAAYNSSLGANSTTASSLNNRIAELQSRAQVICHEFDLETMRRWEELTGDTTLIAEGLTQDGGVSGLVGDVVERIVETRFYITTFVTDWGEESEPSPPSDMLEIDQNDSVTIHRPSSSATGASQSSYSERNITKWRIYRSNSGSTDTAFQFVAEFPITTESCVDEKKNAELGEVCQTITWAEPPYRMDGQYEGFPKPVVGTNYFLRGLIGMPNGIMAGFIDNFVAFCDPYHPYAWPVEYQITTEYPIVGLGVFGQTLFVGTTGNPYFMYGADSASMTAQKLDSNQSCSSRKSIVAIQGGVLYASPDGLCVADQNGVNVASSTLYTREDWQKLTPSSMFAAEHEGIYYLFYSGSGGGCLMFDMVSKKLGRVELSATSAYMDRMTDTLYISSGSSIRAVFGGTARRTSVWKSGLMTLPSHTPFAWLKVYGDQSSSNPVTIRWYGDGVLRFTKVISSLAPVRLPPGRWLEHELEVESTARVTQVVISGTTAELQSV